MQDFFKENPGPRENTSQNRAQLKQKVRLAFGADHQRPPSPRKCSCTLLGETKDTRNWGNLGRNIEMGRECGWHPLNANVWRKTRNLIKRNYETTSPEHTTLYNKLEC